MDVNDPRYAFRKEYDYDNDRAVIFYKDKEVIRCYSEDLKGNFIEESDYFTEMIKFIEDILGCLPDIEIDKEDNNDTWENIWNNLEWDKDSKSYKYKNWTVIILDP